MISRNPNLERAKDYFSESELEILRETSSSDHPGISKNIDALLLARVSSTVLDLVTLRAVQKEVSHHGIQDNFGDISHALVGSLPRYRVTRRWSLLVDVATRLNDIPDSSAWPLSSPEAVMGVGIAWVPEETVDGDLHDYNFEGHVYTRQSSGTLWEPHTDLEVGDQLGLLTTLRKKL